MSFNFSYFLEQAYATYENAFIDWIAMKAETNKKNNQMSGILV